MVPGLTKSTGRSSKKSSLTDGSSRTTSEPLPSSKPPHASANRMESLVRFVKARGFDWEVASSIFGARGLSTNRVYQHQWAVYFQSCKSRGISSSNTTVNNVYLVLRLLRYQKKFSVSTIKSYRSMLASVLRHKGLDLSHDLDIKDVIHSFEIEVPREHNPALSWNFDVVLKFLSSPAYEPLESISLLKLTKKTLFLVALALAKRVSELQALSCNIGFSSDGVHLSLLPHFRAKNDNRCNLCLGFFAIRNLTDLVGPEEEACLCPVRALKVYLTRSRVVVGGAHSNLFSSPRDPKHALSKNGISFFSDL